MNKIAVAKAEDGHLKASNVILVDGRQFRARKEIILTAGMIKTPHILMLSGSDPALQLTSFKIPVVVDNNEVGNNYFDHIALFQLWKLSNPENGLSVESSRWDDPPFSQGLPCDWTVNEGTPPQTLAPALQADAASWKVSDQSLLDPKRSLVETKVIYSPVGAPVPVDGSYIAASVMLLLLTSHGNLHLVSSSPKDPPAINPDYYDTQADRVILIPAFDAQRKLCSRVRRRKPTSSMKNHLLDCLL